MKAALEAAALIEDRVDQVEAKITGLQESVSTLCEECATKGDVDAVHQRAQDAQQQLVGLGGTVTQKADLEQVNQCVQAVRRELTEVVKRKANIELLETHLQDIRQELVQIATVKTDVVTVKAVVQEQVQLVRSEFAQKIAVVQREAQDQMLAVRSELVKMDQENLHAARMEAQQVEKQVRAKTKELAEALDCKADMVALDQQANSIRQDLDVRAQDLDVRADLQQVQSHVQNMQHEFFNALVTKADREKLDSKLEEIDQIAQAKQQELLQVLSGKADKEALNCKVDRELVDDHFQAVQHRLSETLAGKVDKEQVDERMQQLWEKMGSREQLEDLERRVSQTLCSKADRDAVEGCISDAKNIESRLESRLVQVESSKLDKDGISTFTDTVEGYVANMQNLEQRLAHIATVKVDTEKVVELVEAVRDEVVDTVNLTMANSEQMEQQLRNLEQLDINNLEFRANQKMDVRLQSQRQELIDAMASQAEERVAAAREELTDLVSRKIDTDKFDEMVQAMRPQTTESIGAQSLTENTDGDSVPKDWVESLMEQRMRLVKMELSKLVDNKPDTEQVNKSIRAAQKEITTHVDKRVDAAQKQLSEQVGQLAQQQEVVNRRMQQVEHSIRSMTPAAPPERPETAGLSKAGCISWEFDDSRTARVKQLLTQLVHTTD